MTYHESERKFTTWLLKEARARGWLAAHFGSSMRVVRTPRGPIPVGDKDAVGFPDVVLVHPEHGLLFAELKMHDRRSKPKAGQLAWIAALEAAGQRVYVWRPNDEDEILAKLDGSTGTPTRLFDQFAEGGA